MTCTRGLFDFSHSKTLRQFNQNLKTGKSIANLKDLMPWLNKTKRKNLSYISFNSEQQLTKGKLLAIIPWMSTEWIITFTLRLTNRIPVGENCNVIHFRIDNGCPAIFIDKINGGSLISYTNIINGTRWHTRFVSPQNDVETHFELHQRYISNGNYRFFIKLNGEEIHSIISAAQQHYNVEVYASHFWYDACQGSIKNFEFTNFL